MKIFISWSGNRSHQVAQLLDRWIQCVIQAVDPWLSSKDIDKGSLWFTEITNELANTHNGIICLTKSNINKPWILFESGALAKGLSSNRIFTFLVDLEPSDIRDPLAQFNHTRPDKASVFALLRTINNGLGEKSLQETILKEVFNTYWPKFDKEFKSVIKNTDDEKIKPLERSKDDMLNEILYAVRGMDKRLRVIESSNIEETKSMTDIRPSQKVEDEIIELLVDGLEESEIMNMLKRKYRYLSQSRLLSYFMLANDKFKKEYF